VAQARTACIAGACDYLCDDGLIRCDTGCCAMPAGAFARLAAGDQHTCGIDAAGTLKCWGDNRLGQVGDGTSATSRPSPVAVAGAGGRTVRQVGAGMAHACAVVDPGLVGCWGQNGFGQLGDGTFADARVPVQVAGATDAAAVVGGWAHSCALLRSGLVRCWGNGERGVMGDGKSYGGAVPGLVTVQGLSGAAALLGGFQFDCALTGLRAMSCWGDDGAGQLGDQASGTTRSLPVAVANLGGITALRAVALGFTHACAAYDAPGVTGGVRCWGRGASGQLGHGATPAVQAAAVEVQLSTLAPLRQVVALAAGAEHSCALTAAGVLYCWGANLDGQLGDGSWTSRSSAVPVAGLPAGAVGIAAGARHTCALLASGGGESLRCWGWNQSGQLGDGTQQSRNAPAVVNGF
jgi:alpha-tubulin suppressor-like RCC1 family protein